MPWKSASPYYDKVAAHSSKNAKQDKISEQALLNFGQELLDLLNKVRWPPLLRLTPGACGLSFLTLRPPETVLC